jgi:hypothetical protein
LGLLQGWQDVGAMVILSLLCFIWAGHTLLGFCLLTCTFISLISSGSGRTSNEFQPCKQALPVVCYFFANLFKMKEKLLIICLLLNQLIYCQTKTLKLQGNDYLKLIFSTLNCFKIHNDSLLESKYLISNDTLIQLWNTKTINEIDTYGQFAPIKINELDTGFNAISDLKEKVYFLNQDYLKDFYFLKNDSTLIRKTIQRENIWKLVNEREYGIYKIDLGNNRFVYWVYEIGIIYKKNGVLKTNFLPLEYYYNETNSSIFTKAKDSVNIETGYFDFGTFKIKLKTDSSKVGIGKSDKYMVLKNNKIILDNFNLKYYNDKSLVTYYNNNIKFYGKSLEIDSQFFFRSKYDGWDNLELLVQNKIKKVSLQNFATTIERIGYSVCGTVAHYSLKLNSDNATYLIDREILGDSNITKEIPIISKFKYDSLCFISRKNQMNWNGNGGFNDNIILFKNGKEGLYSFDFKDTLHILREILPINFSKISLLSGYTIIKKDGKEEFLNYYMKNKKMRFKKIRYENSTYLRYQKIDNIEGWINNVGILFNDKKVDKISLR